LRGGDPKIEGILEQARKQNIGLTLLHHYGSQLRSDELLNLLGACTSTKMCGSLNSADLSRFASYLQCEPRFIAEQQPKRSFAAHVRGLTPGAVSLSFPFIDLAREPKIDEAAWRAMRAHNQARFGAPPAPHTPEPRQEPHEEVRKAKVEPGITSTRKDEQPRIDTSDIELDTDH
jgi:hypothetical protein